MARKEAESDPAAPDPTLGINPQAVNVGGESILERLAPHIKKIGVALLALVLVLTAVFSYRWYKRSQEEKATARLFRAVELAEVPVIPPSVDLTDPATPPKAADKKSDKPESYATYGERATASLDALAKAGGARGAASVYEAGLLVAAGKLDQALAIYRKVGATTGDDAVLAREGVGIVLETQGIASKDAAQKQKLLEEALVAFRSVQPDPLGLRRDYALYHEARVLEALGKGNEAIAPLQAALALEHTALKSLIENRLAALGATPK